MNQGNRDELPPRKTSETADGHPKSPKIVRLGNFQRSIIDTEANYSTKQKFIFSDSSLDIFPQAWTFKNNQKAEHSFLDDGILKISVFQEHSTPGVICKSPILLPAGSYVFSVVGNADVASTFFPWVANSRKVRLTPTLHLSKSTGPVSVPFKIDKESEVWFGILSHRQEVGDSCYIHSMHIDEEKSRLQTPSSRQFNSVPHSEFIAHQKTELKKSDSGTLVISKPISTPGAYALIDVEPSSTITIRAIVSIVHPSVGFLYVADSNSGKELIRRNVIIDANSNLYPGKPIDIYSSTEIPEETNRVRVGILFSTVTSPAKHRMTIHSFEVCKHWKISDVVDEVYVLSLPDEASKFEICKRQARRIDIEISRWLAVDGSSEPYHSHWKNYLDSPWNEYDNQLGRKAIDRCGAWGYLLSMKGIFKDAISKGHSSIAIFDDDFILSKSFDHRFSKLIENLGWSWKIIYLGASQWQWDDVEITNNPYYLPDNNTNGSFAVIYHKSVFADIISGIDSMNAPFDAGPLRDVSLGVASDESFVAFPNLVIANVEKKGIRDSRNQLEFSKRFGWDLSDFPPWFTSWSSSPSILYDSGVKISDPKTNFVTAVTTLNRKEYLQSFIEDWTKTRSKNQNCTLIVADDGSTDGTVEWLTEELVLEEARLVVIRNDGTGIARQTNSILEFISNLTTPVDAIFMCNDDIRFLKGDWDLRYFEAMISSDFDHLVYFNPEWKEPSHSLHCSEHSGLFSSCSAREAMGCFYTLTPKLIEKIGFFDEESFPVRGHSHIDYTIRACRAGANDSTNIFDIENSNEYIGMVLRDGYIRTHRTLSVHERFQTNSELALEKREGILNHPDRLFIKRSW